MKKGLLVAILLIIIPLRYFSQQPLQYTDQRSVDFDITTIANFNERILFVYELLNDCRFQVSHNEDNGIFTITTGTEAPDDFDLESSFLAFRHEHAYRFAQLDKIEASELAMEYKPLLSDKVVLSLMMDIYVRSRQNNHCADADPFCTDNGLYNFPAGVNAGNGESGPDYDCLYSTPNPAWYYMKIANPGNMNIYMYSTPQKDIDFCCWGPFDDPVAACPSGLTQSKVVSCSYSFEDTETCHIPSSAQTGQYYILVITNYSNSQCNISFSKTSGSGTTDCSIMPPLVNNDGPYCIGDNIHLTGNAQAGASYHWTGPNGFNSTQQNPTINNCNLSHNGTYTCTIMVGNQTSNATTEVHVYGRPTADFTANEVCLGNTTQFTNSSSVNPPGQTVNYRWNFGDGTTSSLMNPTHQFTTAGAHTVTLTATCGLGACPSVKTMAVNVWAMPTANAGADVTIDYGSSAQLHGNGGAGLFDYHWEPADKVTNPNSQNTSTVNLTETTTFTLTVSNPHGGCTSSDQVTVLVNGAAMAASVSASPSSICLGDETQLQVTTVGGTGNYSYTWTPTIGLSAPNTANPTAHPLETTTYNCLVTDGLTSQNVSVTITVNLPEYEEVNQYICPGEDYEFYGSTYSQEGDYDYVTTTSLGCEKIITLHLHHYPSYDNAHTTNASICYGDSYSFHGQPYYATGTYTANLQTIHGCDSIVKLNLLVYPPNDTIIDDQTICEYQNYNFHGTIYSEDGTIAYFDTLDNNGCLKVEKLVLHVGEYQTPPVEEQFICYGPEESPSFYWDKTQHTYTEDTYDEIILPDPNGDCDFKYRLNLKFHQEYYNEDALEVCDEYVWPVTGERFTATDHHIERHFDHYINSNFVCDSTYVLDLTVNHSSETTKIVSNKCDEYVWEFGWNGETDTLRATGNYTKTIPTTHDCDSTVTLSLQLDYSPNFAQVEGRSWVIGGSEFQYTIEDYWVNAPGSHHTEWSIRTPEGFNRWAMIPYGDNYDRCLLYIYTYELDSIELCATTISDCNCGSFTKSKWIHCSSYDVPETSLPGQVAIYPNPNDGDMSLKFEQMTGDIQMKVYDMRGVMVDQVRFNNSLDSQTQRYHSSSLAPGVYVFSFTSKEGTKTKRVVIIK